MLSLAEWFKLVGFVEGNPFALKGADEERDRLREYFIEHQAYHAMVDAGVVRSTILHAPRGAGKSSTRRMCEAYWQSAEYMRPILISLVDWMPVVERLGMRPMNPRDLLAEVFRRFLIALAELPDKPSPLLPRDEQGHLHWIGQTYADYLRPHQRMILERRGWISPRANSAIGDLSLYSLASMPVLQCFEILVMIGQALGYPTCYVVVDGVDEICTTTADWFTGADMIAPLLSNVRMLEIPSIAFKCFIPSEILAILRERGLLREDRIATVEMSWSLDLLNSLLRSRLIVYSDGAIQSLAVIATQDFIDIDMQLCQASHGSPRRLLDLCDQLVHICVRDADKESYFLRPAQLREVVGTTTIVAPTATPAAPTVPQLRLAPDGLVWIGDTPLERSRKMPLLQRRLLEYLVAHQGRMCSTEELIRNVWVDRELPNDKDSLRRLAERLIDLLEPDPKHPIYIDRPYGGYFVLRHAGD